MLGGANRKYYRKQYGTPYSPPTPQRKSLYTKIFFENTEHDKCRSQKVTKKEKKKLQNLTKIEHSQKSDIISPPAGGSRLTS